MGIFGNTGGKRIASMFEGFGSVIGEKAVFKGEFTAPGSVNINGECEGKISAGGEVIVAPGGRVTGELEGESVVISGRVDGNVKSRETLEITKSGRVNGDLAGARINIEEGAAYHGRVTVEGGSQPEQPQNP
ncbi:MAG: polymer-forming cytoskeletal protein [Candidatus Saganbacteria bacterium]|nr:polymer-forming cytoskeletal protein [Candidatus Saganbacteria bacterium]